MGRLLTATAGAVVLAVGFAAASELRVQLPGFSDIATAWATDPQCSIPLTDGTVVEVPPDQAAALATAAATGGGADPAIGVDPALVALQQPSGLTCQIPAADGLAVEAPTASGLTPRAAAVHAEVNAVFGSIPYGGFAPAGVATGHGARSAHYEGRAIDYFFRPVGDEQQLARGWELANWLVANAARLEVAVVIFDDRIWSARRSPQGWRPYTNPDGLTDPISRHLDHVHVDVIRGG